MGARCVCEKQKQIEGTRRDHDALVLCVHRCVVRLCVRCFNQQHEIVHIWAHWRSAQKGCRAQPPRVTAPPRSHQRPESQLSVQQLL